MYNCKFIFKNLLQLMELIYIIIQCDGTEAKADFATRFSHTYISDIHC